MIFRRTFIFGVMWLVLASGQLLGCEKPLFIENESRTPYDRYLALRGRQAVQYEDNQWGGKSPALRERLKPLGAP